MLNSSCSNQKNNPGDKFLPVTREVCSPSNNGVLNSPRNSQENNSDDELIPTTREVSSLGNLPTPDKIIRKTSARSTKKLLKSGYCDFLDNENEFEIEYTSSSWEGSSSEEDNEHLPRNKNKKMRKVVTAEDEVVGEAGCREKKIRQKNDKN